MSDDWEIFKIRHQTPLNLLKPDLIITIYGSYNPPSELVLLEALRDVLIADGYIQTSLVRDRQQSNDDPLDVSEESMLYSNINLLIFTLTGKRLGLVDELNFLTSDPRMTDKIPFSMVFDQMLNEKSSVPDLSQSRINRRRINVKKFETEEQLRISIVKETYWIMRSWAWKYRSIP